MRYQKIISSFTVLVILLLVVAVQAQPVISIQFSMDKSPVGPGTEVRIGEIVTAYVTITNSDMMVGGAALRLTDPGSLLVISEQYPPGLVVGDIFSGVEIGLTDPIPQFEESVVIATVTLFATELTIMELWPANHPNYAEPVVGNSAGMMVDAVTAGGTINVVLRPELGIFFDAAGTVLNGTFIGGPGEFTTAYLMIRDLDVPIESSFLSLNLPPSVSLVGVTLPAGASMTGDLNSDAVFTFSPPLAAPGSTVGLMAELRLELGSEYLFMEPLTVGGHADYGTAPLVYSGFPRYFPGVSLVSTMSIPIGNENMAWGEVKVLFR